jgi:O-antigen/teichoic acid export membrane protein
MKKSILSYLHKILGNELDAKIKQAFLKGSLSSLFLQASLSILTFLITIVVARLTGDKGFGIYTLVFTWVTIVSAAAVFGLDDLALRQMPLYKANEDKSQAKAFLIWGNKAVLFSGLISAIIFSLAAFFLPISGLSEYSEYHFYAALSIPFFVIMHFNQAALRGWGKLGSGQIVEKILQPLFFLGVLFFVYLLGNQIDDFSAIVFRTVSFFLAAAAALYLVYKKLNIIFIKSSTSLNAKHWRKTCFYFMLSTLLYSINTRIDIVFLGIFEIEPEKIAYYNVALKFSDIALIPYLVICTVSTPMFSSLYHQNRKEELQAFYTKITRISALLIALIITVFIALGPWFLSWYGTSFKAGFTVLVLLCITKLVHVFIGPANYLLSMIGQERAVTKALILSVIINIFLQFLLIPPFGIEGAAFATLGGLLFFDISLAFSAYFSSGLWVSVFGKFKS